MRLRSARAEITRLRWLCVRPLCAGARLLVACSGPGCLTLVLSPLARDTGSDEQPEHPRRVVELLPPPQGEAGVVLFYIGGRHPDPFARFPLEKLDGQAQEEAERDHDG